VIPPIVERVLPRVVAAAGLLPALLTGCAGTDCDQLAGLTEQRNAARAAYQELTSAGTATEAETTQADAELHALDARVYDLELSCAR
jgi:hypothetical protein